MSGAPICRVSLPRPVLDSFLYTVPPDLVEVTRPGLRVRVGLGGREAVGLVESIISDGPATASGESGPRLRPILEVLDERPLLDDALLELCRWVADYYAAPIGYVHRAALPPGMLTRDRPSGAARKMRLAVRVTTELPTLMEREAAFGRAHRQRAAFEMIESLGGCVSVSHMDSGLGFSRSVLSGLAERGLAEIVEEVVERDPFDAAEPVERPPTHLNPDQERVLEGLSRQMADPGADPGVALLRGVTGSGKTVIYIRLIQQAVATGRSALVLVPEIGLTPQTVARFRAVFGDSVAVLHSGLSTGERHDAWRAIRAGDRRVVIGTRSAVFAPLVRPGIIVIDEEHDASYKQGESPRYHARAVAAMRARTEGVLLLLGSATPSLESWHNAGSGRYALYELDRRATEHQLPEVTLVDRRQTDDRDDYDPILSDALREGVGSRLDSGQQTLLLLNRRGYATVQQCSACGWVAMCPACNVSLTWHRRRARLVCHHCGWEEPAPARCPSCAGDELKFGGVGTEQVERYLGETFPDARLARMDVDTTGGKRAHARILARVRNREVDILLGTQMIAKGLDLPGVTLVGVIDADVGLNLPDFRAAERTFQLLSQVAGRAGRGTAAGEVLIQTLRPKHFALQATVEHDFVSFAAREIEDRVAPAYPPHLRLANLVVSGRDETSVADAAEILAEWLQAAIETAELAATVVGPAPCPIDRLRGRWRWHMLIKSPDARVLGRLLRYAARQSPVRGSTRLEIDRDPESLL